MSALVPEGTPIAIVAPCHAYDPARLDAGMDIARAHGHTLVPLPDLCRPHRYFAGTDDHRLDQLVTALTSPDFGAVWIARGGSGLTRLLPRVPWHALPRRPVIGFSDATALLNPLHQRVGGVVVHGPVLHSLPQTDPDSVTHLFDLLAGRPTAPLNGTPWAPGAASGPLLGGNLCVLTAMSGTPYQVDAKGAILVIEEVGEAPYRVDRMLAQLVQSGALDGVVGVVVGEMVGCEPPDGVDWTLRDIVMEHLGPLGVPVLGDVAVGHGTRNRAFPIGGAGHLQGARLSWDAPAP